MGRIGSWRRRSAIASQVLVLQMAVVLGTIAVVGAVSMRQASKEYDRLYGERVLTVARSVAALPNLVAAFDDDDPASTIQPIAEAVRVASGADFVVVANRDQVRYSHPEPAKIGQRLSTDASDVLEGKTFVGTEKGSLGKSVRGKTPVYDIEGKVIGIVSVGILQESISAVLWRYARSALAPIAGSSLLLGGLGSYLVARRLRRQTFSLDPRELAGVLEQREAVLHGIREGVLAVDLTGRVTVINEQATRLLNLAEPALGKPVRSLGLEGVLLDALTNEASSDVLLLQDALQSDMLVQHGGVLLVLNRMPVALRGKQIGWVVTLRDQTELVSLQTELLGAKSSSDALRAQAHEFSNRLHTISGLLALKSYDEALRFTAGTAKAQAALTSNVLDRIAQPAIAALLIAKAVSAREHDAELILTPDSRLANDDDDPADLLLVLGNLIDNALQALGPIGGWVEVTIWSTVVGVTLVVCDSGRGIDPTVSETLFQAGVSTKAGTRGLGLALARKACERRGGDLVVNPIVSGEGAQFTATLPYHGVGEATVATVAFALPGANRG